MSVEWAIVITLLLAAILGMLIAICFKMNDFYIMMSRMNQDHQIERKKDEKAFEDIRNEIPNRIEMHGDTYKMYHK